MQIDDVSTPVDDALLVSTLTTNLMGPIRMTGRPDRTPQTTGRCGRDQRFVGPRVRPAGDDCRLLVDERPRFTPTACRSATRLQNTPVKVLELAAAMGANGPPEQ